MFSRLLPLVRYYLIKHLAAYRKPAIIYRRSNTIVTFYLNNLAAYLGLVAIERQAGASLQDHPRLSKAEPAHYRAELYMAAILATQHNPQSTLSTPVRTAKIKVSMIGAVIREFAHLCFGILKTRQSY
jgi:hypothetical protein